MTGNWLRFARRRDRRMEMAGAKARNVTRLKIIGMVFSILLIGCSVPVQPSKSYPEQTGFRGITWGTDVSSLTDMKRVEEEKLSNNGLVWYTKKEDPLMIGKAKLNAIFYGFWVGKLESVWIDFEGDENLEALKKELFDQFGKVPESVKPFYAWGDKETEMSLSYSRDRHKGTLSIISRKISEERRGYKKQKENEERLKKRGS
jgi:hypothetical protein